MTSLNSHTCLMLRKMWGWGWGKKHRLERRYVAFMQNVYTAINPKFPCPSPQNPKRVFGSDPKSWCLEVTQKWCLEVTLVPHLYLQNGILL